MRPSALRRQEPFLRMPLAICRLVASGLPANGCGLDGSRLINERRCATRVPAAVSIVGARLDGRGASHCALTGRP